MAAGTAKFGSSSIEEASFDSASTSKRLAASMSLNATSSGATPRALPIACVSGGR